MSAFGQPPLFTDRPTSGAKLPLEIRGYVKWWVALTEGPVGFNGDTSLQKLAIRPIR